MRTRRHALGQNFLHHKPTIEKIASLVSAEIGAATRPPRVLLEIGPGKLALTAALEPLAESLGLPLHLVERDRYLEETIQRGSPRAALHFMDAATDKFSDLLRELANQGQAPIFVASNLPYSASSQILAKLCHATGFVSGDLISGAVVMVQKEMAQRIAATPKTSDRGALSLLIQSYFETRYAFDVGPGAFSPPPKVMSTVLALRPLETPATAAIREPAKFEHFCKMLFSQRRKMIRNLIPDEKHQLFPKLGISGTERPEVLDLATIVALYRRSFEEDI